MSLSRPLAEPVAEPDHPQLEAQYPCSQCPKIFKSYPAMNRHRVSIHDYDYECFICMAPCQEKVRRHLLNAHNISTVCICACCNFAFADRRQLVAHSKNMRKFGTPGLERVIAAKNFSKPDPSKPDCFKAPSHRSDPQLVAKEPLAPITLETPLVEIVRQLIANPNLLNSVRIKVMESEASTSGKTSPSESETAKVATTEIAATPAQSQENIGVTRKRKSIADVASNLFKRRFGEEPSSPE